MNLLDPNAWGAWFYLGTFLTQILDAIFPPLPQELFALAIPALAQQGVINGPLAAAVTVVGHVLGEVWITWMVRTRRAWLEKRRWGRRLLASVDSTAGSLGTAGSFSVLVGLRFISGGRSVAYVGAGLSKLKWSTVWWSSFVGSVLWVIYMVLIGGILHTVLGLPAWGSAVLGMILGSVFGVVPVVWIQRRRRRLRGDVSATSLPLEQSREEQ